MLRGRRILVGVSGGVAAFKAVYLVRRIVEHGGEVRVMMTASACRFVGSASFAAVTGHHVALDLFGGESVSPHTELAQWADAVVVAPATANTLAKAAHGLADDLVSATLLATTAPVLFAPAMHTEMWENPATQRNVAVLQEDGHRIVGPAVGGLAGGDVGPGRMTEPDEIVQELERALAGRLSGFRVLVTAGGTREPIDPVRFIGNRSSGKMGWAVAAEAALAGAEVILVSSAGLPAPQGVTLVEVETAEEMAEAVAEVAPTVGAVVMAAAVADFRPVIQAATKIRRAAGIPRIELEATPDILAGLSAMDPRPLLVGFAAEIGSIDGAIEKARSKGVDLMVANDVAAAGSGFGSDTNQVALVDPQGRVDQWPLLTKREVARRLCDYLADQLGEPVKD
ncbi:MAG: bifunctional phosphopantothenoylcysteine decarboxylase/phosphopantothenate--cysteine ligase CoaBC [Acidimicrobiia bacterium]|nr:bifunctional phosphopantothenoylcysteine decarboxylase/phosphopantothenate--cysteine ligase CoaBC [Acidimicrobiia bacterium]